MINPISKCANPYCTCVDCKCGPNCRCGLPESYPHYQVPYVPNQFSFPASPPAPNWFSQNALNLSNLIRMLWEQHVTWTRMTIISIAEGLADEDLVTKRLLRNSQDMANALRQFYGDEIASEIHRLFTDHLVIAAKLVKAAKAGDTETATKEEKNWFANADEIAAFLNSINPYWPKEDFRKMLHEHLKLTKDEAVFRLQKQYSSDIEQFDKIEKQALEMADMMTYGLINQFPYLAF